MAGQISWAEIRTTTLTSNVSVDAYITGTSGIAGGFGVGTFGLEPFSAPTTSQGFGDDTFGVGVFETGTPSATAYSARLTGQATSSSITSARLTSYLTTTNTFDVRLVATIISAVSYTADIVGQATTVVTQDARVTSANASSTSYAARLTAQATSSRTVDARLTAVNTTAVSYDSRLTAQQSSAAAYTAQITAQNAAPVAFTAAITARDTTAVSYSGFITAVSAVAPQRIQDIRLTGQATTNVAYVAAVTGQLSNSTSYAARITGSATSTSVTDARITSQSSTLVAYDVRTAGQSALTNIAYDVVAVGQASTSTAWVVNITAVPAPQVAYPIADNVTGTWHVQPLYDKIDEPTLDTSDFIESSTSPTVADICEVQLSSMFDPGVSNGHIVRYAYSKDVVSGDAIDLTVRLMQGGVEIASWTHTDIPPTVQIAAQALSATQANSITDYTDLRLRFEAVKEP